MSITPDEVSRVKRYEGNVNHLYLDTRGNGTIGYGHLLTGPGALSALPFVHKSDGASASTAEKQTEWTTIKAKPFGQQYPATYYDAFCLLVLQQPDIDKLLTTDMSNAEKQLSSNFSGYGGFPQTAKAGLVDMAFNLGIGTLINSYPSFTAAVRRKNWTTAAAECNRNGIPAARNNEVRQLFLQAAEQPAPQPIPRPYPTGSTGSVFASVDIPSWVRKLPAATQEVAAPPAPCHVAPPNLLSGMAGNNIEAQSIVAIVAISSNVTTAAITAITAIAANKQQ